MQNPVGAEFNIDTMRMEMTSFAEVFFNPVAQVKFIHTVSGGYVAASMFVAGISAYYLLKGRDLGFARRSMAVALGFGLASILSVIVLGDESGYEVGDVQKVKLAAIEAEWHTEEPPAAFTLFGWPNDETMETEHAVKIPWLMGIIATRSLDEEVPGIHDLIKQAEHRIRAGIIAYRAMTAIRNGTADEEDRALFDMYKKDLGYALLLKQYTDKVVDATDEQIQLAARSTVPDVTRLFWTFRIMVFSGFTMLFLFVTGFVLMARRRLERHRWLLRAFLYGMDRHRDRLVRCRVRPPALGHRRDPAYLPGHLQPHQGGPDDQPGRLHHLLHSAGNHRVLPDVQVREAGTQLAAYRPLLLRA